MSDATRQRIDKWLWFARLTKTRTLAQKLAISGSVRINRQKNASASRLIQAGDILTIALSPGVRVLRVVSTGTRRGPATEARQLYEDLSPAPVAQPEPPGGGPRPTKRDRRTLEALRRRDDFSPHQD